MPQRKRLFIALVSAVLLAFTGSASARAATGSPFVGLVNENAFAASPGDQGRLLDKVRGIGAGTLRQTLDWSTVERIPGVYDWRAYDGWMAACAKRNIQVLPVLFNAPGWASAKPAGVVSRGTYPPADFDRFAEFAAAAAKRYGPGGSFWSANPRIHPLPVRAWQIWNEPNIHSYWLPAANAARYTDLLRRTSNALKAVDPQANVVVGGLPESRLGINRAVYLRSMYAAGAKDAFDTVGIHAYAKTPRHALARTLAVRKLLDTAGDTDAHLWITEVGWATSGSFNSFRKTRAGQADAIGQLYELMSRNRRQLKLDGVIYFNWRDTRPYQGGKDFWGLHTGLLTMGGVPKPSYQAFSRAAWRIR